jgi:hypothetical protein
MKAKAPVMDEVQAAKRVVEQATAKHAPPLPAGLEEAWKVWSAGVAKVDARGMALLRAAFEAGAEAAKAGVTIK